jgi:hypothetical protein
MALAPGFRLGAYEVLSLLGSGSMGEVLSGRDTRLDRGGRNRNIHRHTRLAVQEGGLT